MIRSSGKLAGFIQVSTLYISVTSEHSSPRRGGAGGDGAGTELIFGTENIKSIDKES